MSPQTTQLTLHECLDDLLNNFLYSLASRVWVGQSLVEAKQRLVIPINLTCSFDRRRFVSIGRDILDNVQEINQNTNIVDTIFNKSLIQEYRMLTIAAKDIIWEHQDFESLIFDTNGREKLPQDMNMELRFLRHIRNASAHENKFFWGRNKQGTINELTSYPINWRNNIIDNSLEGHNLYMDFMKPADLFILLEDVSSLAIP